MDKDRQSFDNVVWDKNDEAVEISLKQLRRKSTCLNVEILVEQKLGKRGTLVSPLIIGGYNILYRIRLEGDSLDVMVRVPCPDLAQFPIEKTLREFATGKYIEQHTQIPVPGLFCHGQHPNIGPFIILQHVENRMDLSDALTVPNQHTDITPTLNPHISETILENLLTKVAFCLLQLSQPKFPRIGSLDEANGYSVVGRPITQNMNNMVQLANIPRAALPPEDKTYGTADEWYIALSEMHIAQLAFQHNDLVSTDTKDDCRNKYVARQLFRKLAKEGKLSKFGFKDDDWSAQSKVYPTVLSPAPDGSGSFRLWCDDFRPANILLDASDDIAAVIDWELAYIAPTQFILDPPWWLLLDVPEMWSAGIDEWRKIYDLRLKTWLSAMRLAEEQMRSGSHVMPLTLSIYMEESWETGRFWLTYASRKSWAFDTIFWKYLDERFFGKRGNDVPQDEIWKTRIHLLGEKERAAMEPFVEKKLEESKERILVDWNPDQAKERLAELLFD